MPRMPHASPPPQAAARVETRPRVEKRIGVRRSDRTPTLYWWSLPLPLRDVAHIYADGLAGSRALVYPAAAVAGCGDAIGAAAGGYGTARVDDVTALLQARHEGRVGACRMAIFPASRTDADLALFAARMQRDIELTGFTIAIQSSDASPARHEFCFRVPGKVLDALQFLAAGRTFGDNLGQIEMALLQGLTLRPKQRTQLDLVLAGDAAELVGRDPSGRRRVQYLETGKGYTGVYEELTLRQAVGARTREAWRQFPIGVVMFAGLPLFIGAFWAKNALSRKAPRKRAGAPRS
jgi:hypothetical protein